MTSLPDTRHFLARNDEDEEDKKTDSKEPSHLIEKHLFSARTVMITGPVTMDMARDVCARLHAMAYVSEDPITVIVSSPGGHVESGDMIHDTLKFVGPRIRMLGSGWVASAGALIYAAAEKEDRYCLPNTRFLLHQPSGGVTGSASDVEIQMREITRMRDRLNKIFADATGQPVEEIEARTDRDFWMSAEEAVDFGLATHIIRTKAELN